MTAAQLSAQVFTVLHSFTAVSGAGSTNSDGANPPEGLVLSGDTLYGAASGGGSQGSGLVFAMSTDGTEFRVLHTFTAVSDADLTNSEGRKPWAGLTLSGDTLYGIANEGGTEGCGTVFALNTDGTSFRVLRSFAGARGDAYPSGALLLSGDTLYGAAYGGDADSGSIFTLKTDGTSFRLLRVFGPISGPDWANAAGAYPDYRPVLSGNTLYGTASSGGSAGNGTLYAVNTDATGFRVVHTFLGGSDDGASPETGLIISGATLYGVTSYGGESDQGTVFSVNPDGTGFTVLHSFTGTNGESGPYGPLLLSGDTLYGSTVGTDKDSGMVFALSTNGTGFTTLHVFPATSGGDSTNSDGAYPQGGLVLSGNTLYGTTGSGGKWGTGTLFSLALAPRLTITPSGANVILTWPTNYAGFILQSSANLDSSTVWTTNSLTPVVVSGLNIVTNPVSGSAVFFRLSQ